MKCDFGIEDVIERGICIGCGACDVRTQGKVFVALNSLGLYEAKIGPGASPADVESASAVCPFSDAATNETTLSLERHGDLPDDRQIGRYRHVLAGRLRDDDQVVGSSSGGLTTFVLSELLRLGDIDGVIHVGRSEGSELFEYSVSTTAEDLLAKRKSNYYATTLADVVSSVKGDGRRYAVAGIPCFIKAMRLLVREVPEFSHQFVYFVGLLCGHLKSQFFAESLAWQLGVPPNDLEAVDFRVKDPASGSHRYNYSVKSRGEPAWRTGRVAGTIDGNWGYAAFQPEACNFCDDVFAETADVVFGDAWLPQYTDDWRGTNVVVVRDARIGRILMDAVSAGLVSADNLSPSQAASSQAGNFRHRHDGLQVRLLDDLQSGLKVPKKRLGPRRDHVSRRRVALVRCRRGLSRLSLTAFRDARASEDLEMYAESMRREMRKYDFLAAVDRGPWALVKYVGKILLRK